MSHIILADGTKVRLSQEDVKEASKIQWYLTHNGYPYGRVGGVVVYLHKWVAARAGLCLDELIDHEDRNPLNATRSNLRYANKQLNAFNRSIVKNSTSGFKGVTWHKLSQCWFTQVKLNGKHVYRKYFDDPISAAVAYDIAAVEYFGAEFACTNLRLGLITLEDYARVKPPREPYSKSRGKFPYKGVSLHCGKPRAAISHQGKSRHIGYYNTPLEAAIAYDSFIIENGLERPTNASLGLL